MFVTFYFPSSLHVPYTSHHPATSLPSSSILLPPKLATKLPSLLLSRFSPSSSPHTYSYSSFSQALPPSFLPSYHLPSLPSPFSTSTPLFLSLSLCVPLSLLHLAHPLSLLLRRYSLLASRLVIYIYKQTLSHPKHEICISTFRLPSCGSVRLSPPA